MSTMQVVKTYKSTVPPPMSQMMMPSPTANFLSWVVPIAELVEFLALGEDDPRRLREVSTWSSQFRNRVSTSRVVDHVLEFAYLVDSSLYRWQPPQAQ